MSRLASLTPSRPRSSPSPSPSPSTQSSPSRQLETTHHRMLKLVLVEVRNVLKTWDELGLVGGVKAGKGCIDEATEMDNILGTVEGPERPPIAPHLEALHTHRAALTAVLSKLDRLLIKLSALIDQAEKILFEACKTQTNEFVFIEPLWSTWTLEHFVNSLPPLHHAHITHLVLLTSLSETIQSPSTSFDEARLALERWRDLARGGERWDAARDWEELVALELGEGAGNGNGNGGEEEEGRTRRKKR